MFSITSSWFRISPEQFLPSITSPRVSPLSILVWIGSTFCSKHSHASSGARNLTEFLLHKALILLSSSGAHLMYHRVRLELIQSKPWNAHGVVSGSLSSSSLATSLGHKAYKEKSLPLVVSFPTFSSSILIISDCSFLSPNLSSKWNFFTFHIHCCFPFSNRLALNVRKTSSRPQSGQEATGQVSALSGWN